MLTADQINSFKQEGYLVLRGVIEPVLIDVWRRSFWRAVDADQNDPAIWKKAPALRDFRLEDESAALCRHPKIAAAIEQLGGGKFFGDAGPPLVRWPSGGNAWALPEWGHVDAYPPTFWFPFMLCATAYAYDVKPMGGGFTYWPGSHRTTHQWFLERPEMIDGRWAREPGFNWDAPNDFTSRAPHPAREFTGRAGDVILWHAFLVHSASVNIRSWPRVGFFSRYCHRDQEAIKHEVPQNLWKHWGI